MARIAINFEVRKSEFDSKWITVLCETTKWCATQASLHSGIYSFVGFTSVFIIHYILSTVVMLHPWLFLQALTVFYFCFCTMLLSVQLYLASPSMGKRPWEAATQLKIDFQVEPRVFPSPCFSLSISERQILPLIREYLWRAFYLKLMLW